MKPREGALSHSPERLVRQLFLGFVKTHILYHASKEPVCGVGLADELKRHGYKLSPGTLYPTLHHLAADGYLRCITTAVRGRRRKCYRITQSGRSALKEAKHRLRELVEEVLEQR
jgi:PadR family transcriptional regulator PadR